MLWTGASRRLRLGVKRGNLDRERYKYVSLACAAAFEKKKAGRLAPAGIALSIAGFLIFMPGIRVQDVEWQAYGKLMLVLGIFSFSIGQVCLLGLVPLGRSLRWIFFAVAAVIFALASLTASKEF